MQMLTSIVSAYFTIYAFAALRQQLLAVSDLKFLFGEPRFVSALDPERTEKKTFRIEDDQLYFLTEDRDDALRETLGISSLKDSWLLRSGRLPSGRAALGSAVDGAVGRVSAVYRLYRPEAEVNRKTP